MVTLSGLEYHLSGVPPEALDRPCTDGHLKELALRLTGWQEIGMFLDLDEGEMEDIECSVRQVRARNLMMLRKWRKKFGKNATYRYTLSIVVCRSKLVLNLCFSSNDKYVHAVLLDPCA